MSGRTKADSDHWFDTDDSKTIRTCYVPGVGVPRFVLTGFLHGGSFTLPDKLALPARTGDEDDQMRFLITGGAGFIGSHLADELVARGNQVHVLDDLSTGSIENIGNLEAAPTSIHDRVGDQRAGRCGACRRG